MTDKELKRLSRAELLEMLLAQVEENKELNIRLDEMQARLESRQILLSEAGSIAEAALRLNGVFQAAETAAAQYLENIRRLSGEEEASCRRMEAEARKEAEAIRAEAEAYSRRLRSQADQYQRQAAKKVQDLLREQEGPRSPRRPCGEERKA